MVNEPTGQVLAMPDAQVVFYPTFFSEEERDRLFEALCDGIAWKQQSIRLYGKAIPQPRLTAWYGDEGRTYTYSGLTQEPEPWTPALAEIKRAVEEVAPVRFNSVLLNRYRGGQDSVSWHADDEPELGPAPVIASVSFGATRRFQFRHRQDRQRRLDLDLTPGSLLLMMGPTQHHWMHQVPKTARPVSERINLTFRIII